MLQYHTRLLLPQLIPHSRLQGGWSFIQIKCLSLFCGVFLFQIQKDILSGLGAGDSWKAVGCRESGGWTKEHLQLHEHHYKVLQAMLMKQTMMLWMLWNTKEAMLIRIDRESAGLRERARREGWWGGEEVTFFPSCLHFVLSCLHLGEEVIFSSSCPDKWSPKCRPWTGQRWSAPQPGILKVRPQGDEKTLHRT